MLSRPADSYFDIVGNGWLRAQAKFGAPIERVYEVAGQILDLQFAGPELLPVIAPAFAHLERPVQTAPASLTIRLWDSESTGVGFPKPPCCLEDFKARGELPDMQGSRIYGAYQSVGRILSLFDPDAKLALVCIQNARQMPTADRGSPLRSVLSWWMREHGHQLVHAASVGTPNGGVLIVGKGGAGKSNTALGCLLAGLSHASDDFCIVSAGPPPMVYSLYCTAKARPEDWAKLPFPPSNPNEPEIEKRLYYLHPHFSERLALRLPILAVLLPRRGGIGDPTLRRIPATGPILETARETSVMLPHAAGEVLPVISRICQQVPCFALYLGSVPHRIPDVLRRLIDSLAAEDRTHE